MRAKIEAKVKQQEEEINALQAKLAELQGSKHLCTGGETESEDEQSYAVSMAKRERETTGGPSTAPPTKRRRTS